MSAMFKITLPDGSVREMPEGSTPADVAAAIGPGLAKAALAARVDGELRDLNRPFEGDARWRWSPARDEKDALELVRHDFAHVLAEAVQNLFPGTQITFGPATDDGFYYDFAPAARPRPVHRRGSAGNRGGDAARHRRRQAAGPRSVGPRAGAPILPRPWRKLQGRVGDGAARRRADHHVQDRPRRGRLDRPVPRAASRLDRQARPAGVQADPRVAAPIGAATRPTRC